MAEGLNTYYLIIRRSLVAALMLFGLVMAKAQPYNSVPPPGSPPGTPILFQVDQKKGCNPLTVNITVLLGGLCTGVSPCTMTFGDNTSPVPNTFTHTYTTSGTFTLSVQPQSNPAQTIVITVDQDIQPNFEIHACAVNRAQIKVIDNNYDQYLIDFRNDGPPVDHTLPFSNDITTPTYNYGGPGTYTPAVRGRDLNSADNCTAKVQSFTSLGVLPTPAITKLTMLDASSLSLDFTTAAFVLYRLEVATNAAAPFQLLQTLYGTNTATVNNLKLDQNYYCFRLGAHNPCTGATTYSNTICSNRLVVTAQSDQITVNSNMSNTGIVNYTIDRTSPMAPPVTINTGTEPFIDIDVECKTTYCYKVTTNYGIGRTSVSLEKCTTAFSTTVPTAIDDVTGTVGPGGATMTWTQDPLFEPIGYSVQRSSAGSPFAPISTTSASPFTDNIYTTEGKYCYKMNYVDKCDNPSDPGVSVCPVQLNGTLNISNEISLNWSRYRGWKAGVDRYILEKYDLNGRLIASIIQNDTVYQDIAADPVNQYVRYVIKAIPNDRAMGEALSNERVFIRSSNLYYPTAFTPNKDNLNDGFIVQGQYIVKIKLTIFDRWGSVLFSTEKNEPWDGNSSGRAMPPSTYVWKADITDRAGQVYSREGTVALIRD